MRIIREIRNVLDGEYTVRDADEKRERNTDAAGRFRESGFREGESRVIRRLLDAGLAIPQIGEAKPKKRG